MSRSLSVTRSLPRPIVGWPGALLAVALASASGLLIARILLDPGAGDLGDLAIYFAVSGVGTVTLGWLAFRLTDRSAHVSIQAKAFLGATIGTAVALANIFVVAGLMFLSTSHDLKLLIALLLFSAVITAYFSLRVATALTTQIGAIAHNISALADGDYGVRVPYEGYDEAGRLARHVNDLAERLAHAEAARATLDGERRALTAAISHDLRTPLASVRAMLEALDDGIIDEPAEIRRYYATMRREIERLNRMIDDLFELAQIDAGALRLHCQPVAVAEIAAEVVDAMQEPARRAGIELRLRVEGEPSLMPLDGARIERVIANLLRNALTHTPAGGAVTVNVADSVAEVRVDVTDTGEGMHPADLPYIWDRFYRGERSRYRGQNDDGAGLGLAIVRGIVEAHGGTVTATSALGAGTTFSVHLPRVAPAASGPLTASPARRGSGIP